MQAFRTDVVNAVCSFCLFSILFIESTVSAQGLIAPNRQLDPEAGMSAILLGTGIPLPQADIASA